MGGCPTLTKDEAVNRDWNFPCYKRGNSMLFLALSARHRISVTFCGIPRNFSQMINKCAKMCCLSTNVYGVLREIVHEFGKDHP